MEIVFFCVVVSLRRVRVMLEASDLLSSFRGASVHDNFEIILLFVIIFQIKTSEKA